MTDWGAFVSLPLCIITSLIAPQYLQAPPLCCFQVEVLLMMRTFYPQIHVGFVSFEQSCLGL